MWWGRRQCLVVHPRSFNSFLTKRQNLLSERSETNTSYNTMQVKTVTTLVSMAENCISMHCLRQIHAHAMCRGLYNHPVILGKIFRFVSVSHAGDLLYAQRLFDQIPQPNTFFYNILIRGYSKSARPWFSVRLFNQMRQNFVDLDGYTFTFLLKARSRMKMNLPSMSDSDEIHAAIIKCGFCSYLYVQNGLIHLYAVKGIPLAAQRLFDEAVDVDVDVVSWSGLVVAYSKAGQLELARWVFDEMPERDVVSWTAMVSGYSQAKLSREALELFSDMKDAGIRPDEVTMVSVISACTNLGDPETGKVVHHYINANGLGWMISLCNALIDMYAKCGCMDQAWKVFNNMSRKSLVTWNSMILACANQGNPDDTFVLFKDMLNLGALPDSVTFLALLTACTHRGWIEEAYRLFDSMQRDYCMQPGIEHYGCMVDMLGKAGRLEEAYTLITGMPMPNNEIVWGALLAACRIYGDVNMGERVVKKLLELNPDEGGYYILLRDIYVAASQIGKANEMRQSMEVSGVRKTAGCSWVGA